MKIVSTTLISIDYKTPSAKLINDPTLWKYAANEWHKLISPYTPMATGNLRDNVRIEPKTITYYADYAAKMYSNNYNFRRDKNQKATCRWDKAAEATEKAKLIRAMQEYIDRGGIEL